MPFDILVPSGPTVFSAPRCGLCGLYTKCKSPKMPVYGKGKKEILVCGEAPGEQEDKRNRPFVGPAGQFLKESLDLVGINMERDCWLTNSLICRPPNNATPTNNQISYCYPNIKKVIQELNPKVILTVGRSALQSVLTEIWQDDLGNLSRWVGWKIPCRKFNAWIIPTYHPSFVLRELNNKSPVQSIFLAHLKMLSDVTKKPYKQVPTDRIRILHDTQEAAQVLQEITKQQPVIAFDYETSSLKPDEGGSIVSAAVAWNDQAISFPWYGNHLLEAWDALMKSKCPKVAHNLIFEDRWTTNQQRPWKQVGKNEYSAPKRLFMKVNNWVWDTMVMAHVLDGRKGICSLGFQSLILLGVENYWRNLPNFNEFQDTNGKQSNKIFTNQLDSLLEYNAKDALYTLQIANKQRKKLKLPPL